MHASARKPATDPAREAMIRELRERYLNGTIDEVLIPEDPNLDGLLADIADLDDEGGLTEAKQPKQVRIEIA